MIQTKMEILKVIGVNAITVSLAYSLSETKDLLAIISILIGIAYAIWKWRNDVKAKNQKK